MPNPFFERPILNSPYEYPSRHWELDETGQPTQQIIESRRRVSFITPIPKPKKQGGQKQYSLGIDEGKGLSTDGQRYDATSTINEIRNQVDIWRKLPSPSQWLGCFERSRDWSTTRQGAVRPRPNVSKSLASTAPSLLGKRKGYDASGRRVKKADFHVSRRGTKKHMICLKASSIGKPLEFFRTDAKRREK